MHISCIDAEVRAPFGLHSIYVADLIPFLVEGREIRAKVGVQETSAQELRLEAVLLARILKADPDTTETAHMVARAEARRLYRVAMAVVDHLHNARTLFASELGCVNAELLAAVFNIEDAFQATIAKELLAWRDAATLTHRYFTQASCRNV